VKASIGSRPAMFGTRANAKRDALVNRITSEVMQLPFQPMPLQWGKGRTGTLSPVRVVCLGVIGCEATRLSRKPEHCTSSKRFLSVRRCECEYERVYFYKGSWFCLPCLKDVLKDAGAKIYGFSWRPEAVRNAGEMKCLDVCVRDRRASLVKKGLLVPRKPVVR